MNIANQLTMLRIVLVFVFMAVIWIPVVSLNATLWIALAIFIIASVTDFLDGYLAFTSKDQLRCKKMIILPKLRP